MESHTVMGAQQLLQMKNIPHLAVLGALEHHLQYDGTGYPSLPADWKPNIASQMIAVADVFDALRSRLSYSDPKSLSMTVKILTEEKGTTLHPILVDNFLGLINR
jgi:HD-GYP domain-containing protein (c-di-GMP phosphodiesterase class II)